MKASAYADVVEWLDTLVLETSAERREGSSPSIGTNAPVAKLVETHWT